MIAGEGGGVNVLKSGAIIQSLTIPAESVWTVCVIPNGDIVTGSRQVLNKFKVEFQINNMKNCILVMASYEYFLEKQIDKPTLIFLPNSMKKLRLLPKNQRRLKELM